MKKNTQVRFILCCSDPIVVDGDEWCFSGGYYYVFKNKKQVYRRKSDDVDAVEIFEANETK